MSGPTRELPGPSDPFDADRFGDELRSHLHHAVAGVRPAGDALDHIRTAIPVRRRRRQVTAATLAVVLIGGGSAAALTTAGSGGGGNVPVGGPALADQTPSASASGRDHQQSQSSWGTGGRSPRNHAPGNATEGATTPGPGTQPSVRPGGAGPAPTGSSAPPQPCAPSSLQQVTAPATTSSGGYTYGSIRVTTTSAVPCTIADPPSVHASSSTGGTASPVVVTSASPTAVQQVLNPAPSTGTLTLPAHGSYEIRFAWSTSTASASAAPCTRASGSASGTQTWTLAYAVSSSATPSPTSAATVATVTLPSSCGAPTLYITDAEPVSPAATPAVTTG